MQAPDGWGTMGYAEKMNSIQGRLPYIIIVAREQFESLFFEMSKVQRPQLLAPVFRGSSSPPSGQRILCQHARRNTSGTAWYGCLNLRSGTTGRSEVTLVGLAVLRQVLDGGRCAVPNIISAHKGRKHSSCHVPVTARTSVGKLKCYRRSLWGSSWSLTTATTKATERLVHVFPNALALAFKLLDMLPDMVCYTPALECPGVCTDYELMDAATDIGKAISANNVATAEHFIVCNADDGGVYIFMVQGASGPTMHESETELIKAILQGRVLPSLSSTIVPTSTTCMRRRPKSRSASGPRRKTGGCSSSAPGRANSSGPRWTRRWQWRGKAGQGHVELSKTSIASSYRHPQTIDSTRKTGN